jgi:AmmeMemoRadiSam system protein B
MATLERPKLRPLRPCRVEHDGGLYVGFEDSLGVANPGTLVPASLYARVVLRFDGRRTLQEIQAEVLRETGQLVSAEDLTGVIEQLDRAMVLDGPAFAAFRTAYGDEHVRPAAFAGRSYAGTERALRAQLTRFFTHERGAGLPAPTVPSSNGHPGFRGILSPHIDFGRGGPIYTWAYRELVERSDADVFVIVGVAHQVCEHRFVLTRKDFETPLGLARTDRSYVDRIAALAGYHLFDDELAHRVEHSIEFQVVFLQFLLGGRRDFSIVPVLVGSFHDLMDRGTDPIASPEVRRFIGALRAAESACSGKVAYIGGIDLGHVGREFGDANLVDPATLEALRSFDEAMLSDAAASDPAAWFRRATAVDNRWRICGLAATYTMLHAMGPARGTLLRYDQAVNPERTCCVSFASVAFEAPRGFSKNGHVRTVTA